MSQIKFLGLTLDASVSGKRERDIRMGLDYTGEDEAVRFSDQKELRGEGEGEVEGMDEEQIDPVVTAPPAAGIGEELFAGTASDLTWDTTLSWLSEATHLPIVLKGTATYI